jgi:hypothetical protein
MPAESPRVRGGSGPASWSVLYDFVDTAVEPAQVMPTYLAQVSADGGNTILLSMLYSCLFAISARQLRLLYIPCREAT